MTRHRPVLSLDVQVATRSANLPSAEVLREWCRAALVRDCEVTIRLVGTREGLALNSAFRERDYPTNVLTFVYETSPACVGDIAICAPVVRREARAQGKALEAHWAHLVVHGMLHLQGYDHLRDADARLMEQTEAQILADLGYPDPYAVAA